MLATRTRQLALSAMRQADAHAAMAKAIRSLAESDPKAAESYLEEARRQDALFEEYFETAAELGADAGMDLEDFYA